MVEGLISVTIAVPTFRRAERLLELLPRLLEEAAGFAAAAARRPRIMVIDNDQELSARPVVERYADQHVEYFSEPEPGVVSVRNRALREAWCDDALVFIDDDQLPTRGWLTALVTVWLRMRPAGVAGPVHSPVPAETDSWIREGGFFDRSYRDRLRTGDAINEAATTNLLVDMASVRAENLLFDPRFALSGGEDSHFTRRLTQGDRRIAWCSEAVVVENLPDERLTRLWVLRRAVSSGNTLARVSIATTSSSWRRVALMIALGAGGASRVFGGTTSFLFGLLQGSVSRRAKASRSICRGVGIILGSCGWSYLEYARGGARWQPSRRCESV